MIACGDRLGPAIAEIWLRWPTQKSPEGASNLGAPLRPLAKNWGFFSSDQYLAMTATGPLPQLNR
jgi:hypothetical protein